MWSSSSSESSSSLKMCNFCEDLQVFMRMKKKTEEEF